MLVLARVFWVCADARLGSRLWVHKVWSISDQRRLVSSLIYCGAETSTSTHARTHNWSGAYVFERLNALTFVQDAFSAYGQIYRIHIHNTSVRLRHALFLLRTMRLRSCNGRVDTRSVCALALYFFYFLSSASSANLCKIPRIQNFYVNMNRSTFACAYAEIPIERCTYFTAYLKFLLGLLSTPGFHHFGVPSHLTHDWRSLTANRSGPLFSPGPFFGHHHPAGPFSTHLLNGGGNHLTFGNRKFRSNTYTIYKSTLKLC